MRRKILTICEVCGGTKPSGAADFLVFHCLTFCSPDCLDDYCTIDEERRAKKETGPTIKQTTAGRPRAA